VNIESEVMIGNHAIARGLFEAGLDLAAAYPGTPSSEILPGIVKWNNRAKASVYAEWSTNERCAFEVAFGAAASGKRAACMMKQVGLNVAFPSLLRGRHKGIEGALVIVSCDDPGPQSSQTEQDTRLLATLFGIPLATVKDWEQGRRRPEIPIRAYLAVIQRDPQAVIRALRAA